MRILSPASRGSFAIRFSAFDACWAFLTPWLALWIRGAQVLSPADWPAAVFYCSISFSAALIAFLVFRIRDGMTHLFSVHDAIEVAKAVLLSEFVTCLVLFSATRLDGVPRSTPLIHALILSLGLIIARAFVRMTHSERVVPAATGEAATEHIVAIGSNRLSSLYIDFLHAYAPGQHRVIAVLDDHPEMIGRAIAGVRVLGPTLHLLPVIEEFKEHGIHTDRIVVGGDPDFLSPESRADINRVCNDRKIQLDFIPDLIGLSQPRKAAPAPPAAPRVSAPMGHAPRVYALSGYFSVKRYIDLCLVSILIVLLLPVFIAVATIVLLDVGSPVFFWQRRIGMNGQIFQMHKFRTLKPSFDWDGQPVASTERISWVGGLLRKFRLDELPQLLNVLVGDMSLIGPRPLLPRDQPPDPAFRLTVRPGMTGWAQVCGGNLLTPLEKNALDEWYIRNASLAFDLKIVGKTILVMLGSERRAREPALSYRADAKMPIGQPADRVTAQGS
ncbi:MAG: sugar transferase [Pseudolabrys sp.]|nr:sugar transferase [Pseudolabrys sp.]